MNSKKTKGKSHLPPSTKPTQVDNSDEIESKCLDTDKTRVPEIGNESINVEETDQSPNVVPKKPKRSKGSKKKQILPEDFKNKNSKEEIYIESKNVTETLENIEHFKEDISIVPCARKNKKKVKKQDESLKENLDLDDQKEFKCVEKDSEKEISIKLGSNESELVRNPPEIIDVAHKDDASFKKKKKKKRQHDSEKSDMHNPCTMAFQKLVQPFPASNDTDNKNDSIESQHLRTEIVECTELKSLLSADSVHEEEKYTETTIKKKKKKGKKNPSESRTEIENVEELSLDKKFNNDSKGDISLIESCEKTSIDEIGTKPKAKIVKPVQKKRPNKLEIEAVKTLPDSCFEIETNNNRNKDVVNLQIEKTKTAECGSHEDNNITDENIAVLHISETVDSHNIGDVVEYPTRKQEIQNNPEDTSNLLNMSEMKKKPEMTQNYDHLGFVEVKSCKGKKKRNRSAFQPDACETSEHGNLTDKDAQNMDIILKDDSTKIPYEEQATNKIIVPDFIEYPRSTSQQHIHGNNNTVIKEITSTEQVKLDFPVCNEDSSPIIQGSGESPETLITKYSDIINVTEIDVQSNEPSIKDNIELQSLEELSSENIDIKSKMIEVNRDMLELKSSIERSLAELTASKKNDTIVDKEFEELFQCQSEQKLQIEKENDGQIFEKKCDIKGDKTSEETSNNDNNNFDLTINKAEQKDLGKNSSLLLETISDSSENKPDKQEDNIYCSEKRDKIKNKSKRKGKKEVMCSSSHINTPVNSGTQTANSEKDSNKKSEKSEQKSDSANKKSKQQTISIENDSEQSKKDISFEPIENFEDALTSSVDDINHTFEIMVKDATQPLSSLQFQNNPQINIISPTEDSEGEDKRNKSEMQSNKSIVSRPKNLLGHTNIPVSSNKTDFKKEKYKPPSSILAKVKINSSAEIEKPFKRTSQIGNEQKLIKESNRNDSTCLMKANEDLIYKYSFRKVFFQNTCHVCKKDLGSNRLPCKFCSLVFYCSLKHKEEDWSQHQSLCFAVCTIAHLKEQKHIYADSQNILDQNYRVLRMQAILSCEKILNRKLVAWEQEALLYPRLCSDVKCRQWKQELLKDCEGCSQLSHCIDHPEHLAPSHQRWCKSYALYQKLVNCQLMKGRLEPPLPTRVLKHYLIPGKINDVLGSIYEEKIDMDDIQYAALTQIATGPLTAAYSYQLYSSKLNSTCTNGKRKNATFTIHTVGAELSFEADSLNKWETFFLHLRSDVQDLKVVMVGTDINPSHLPLDLLAKIKLCDNCQSNKRRVLFEFHDNESYHNYYMSDGFATPDLVCAFNPSIYRASVYDTDTWPATINNILKQRVPFVLTSYSIEELRRDLGKVREYARVDFNVVTEIKYNPFSSVRPDRNFITDHEIPLLFKNYCFCVLCGTL